MTAESNLEWPSTADASIARIQSGARQRPATYIIYNSQLPTCCILHSPLVNADVVFSHGRRRQHIERGWHADQTILTSARTCPVYAYYYAISDAGYCLADSRPERLFRKRSWLPILELYTRHITTSALALQSQYRNANLAPARPILELYIYTG